MKEQNIQIKMSTFTKMLYLSMHIPALFEQGEIVITEQMYNDLLSIQDDLHAKMNAKDARLEYKKNLDEKKKGITE